MYPTDDLITALAKVRAKQKDLLAAKQFLANAQVFIERYLATLVPESYDAGVVGPMPGEIKELIRARFQLHLRPTEKGD